MQHLAACTITAKSYLSLARVLARSFQRFHPDLPFFVLLADEIEGYFDPEEEPYTTVFLKDLDLPDKTGFLFRYSQQELTYALTPFLLRHLLTQGYDGVAFFKQESLVLDDLSSVLYMMQNDGIVLTPHLLDPLEGAGKEDRELNILQSGVYNVGFLGVSKGAESQRFLQWWQDRLARHCLHAVAQGMHYEQRWLDFVPAYFKDVGFVRDPGFNVAHWNLPDRKVVLGDGEYTVAGAPLSFMRFSGFDPDRPEFATRYSNRLTMESLGPAAEIFRRYLELLVAANYHQTKNWPYAYNSFDNGAPIPYVARQVYRNLGDHTQACGNPFETVSHQCYFNWLNQPVNGSDLDQAVFKISAQMTQHIDNMVDTVAHAAAGMQADTITRLWWAVYEQRPDLQDAFPDPAGQDLEDFLHWTVTSGAKEMGASEHFLKRQAAQP